MITGLNTVDLSAFLSGKSTPEQDRETARAFVHAASTVGFFYVSGWESVVPQELVEQVFEDNARFFSLPQSVKDRLEYTSSRANRGYLSMGREQPSLSKDEEVIAQERIESGDQKETFEIGNDCDPVYPEHWPEEEERPGFKETMNKFHLLCHQLHLRILSLLAMSLDLAPDYFVAANSGRAHNLRLLHYPPARRNGCSSRLGAHTDFGTVTLLWQDSTGGLQVTGPDGEWVDVVPKPNTFVINIGDILARWSNDKLKSTIHRAILPALRPGEDPTALTKTRRSVAYFCNPDPDAVISCIPGLGEPKYKPISAGDYYAAALEGEIGVSAQTTTTATPRTDTANLDPTLSHTNSTAPPSAPLANNTSSLSTGGHAPPADDLDENGYPPQKHAGKVGYGPNYHHHPTTGDKIQGTKEILEGKILRKPEPVEHGLERKTGELEEKKKQEEDSADPFAKPDEGAGATKTTSRPSAADVRESGAAAKATAATASTKSSA